MVNVINRFKDFMNAPVDPGREKFLKGISISFLALLAACGPRTTPEPTSASTPTIQPSKTDETVQNESLDLLSRFDKMGIRVELPNPNWPTSYQEVTKVLKGSGDHNLTADKITAIVETDRDGKRVWRGWYIAEPPFPLKDGVTYDEIQGYHIRTSDNQPVFDPLEIFATDWEGLPTEVKDNFANLLVDVKLNRPGIGLFARIGGIARQDASPANTHHFLGSEGVEVKGVEQLSLIPVQENLCVSDPEESAVTRSFRQAALEFRDNKQTWETIDGKRNQEKITVKWFDPETSQFKILDGRLISELTQRGYNLDILDKLPANTPLSTEEMTRQIGGQSQNWVVNPATWEWFYEAFKFKSGVQYVEGIGHFDSNDRLLVGVEQTSSATSEVFDFSRLDTAALASFMKAPGKIQAVLFARAGMAPNDSDLNNHSWYTWGEGDVRLSKPAIEQAAFMIVNLGTCLVGDWRTALYNRAKLLAVEQPDPAVKAFYWDGDQFAEVQK